VGWTEFTLEKSVILFSRSTDGGSTWSKPVEISTHEGLPRDETGSVEGFTGAVGADGTVYVVWADGSEIAFATSRDGGQSFSRSRSILKTAPSYFDVFNVARGNGFPQIATDPRSNRLFVVWADYRNGDIDVFCSTSTDRGKHWSPPLRVNSDALHNGADQFMQWLAVDPTDGSANVIFYDRRGDPDNRKATIVLARCTDGGKTFANYAWDPDPFDPDEQFIGDYSGITAFAGRVFGVWARTAEADEKPESTGGKSKKVRAFVAVGVADFTGK
jgi:Neuraminidase (sialidase)